MTKNIKLKPLTVDDFVPRVYDWAKISQYAITKTGFLIKLDKILSDGFPVHLILFEGRWEVPEFCHAVGIRDILEAEPVKENRAKNIIRNNKIKYFVLKVFFRKKLLRDDKTRLKINCLLMLLILSMKAFFSIYWH